MTKLPDTLTWKAPSHIEHQRAPGWYLLFIICSLGLLAFAFYIKSITAGITFFLIVAIVFILSNQSSREITYKVTKSGIVAGNMVYPYKIIKRFWIIYNPPEVKILNFETTAYLNNRVVLQLGHQDPVQLKLVLGNYIPEDLEMEESVTETLARKLKI